MVNYVWVIMCFNVWGARGQGFKSRRGTFLEVSVSNETLKLNLSELHFVCVVI